MAALPVKEEILAALREGEVNVQGQFLSGSNYTFMAEVMHEGQEFIAVYKPVRGEQPLWDFPSGTLSKREVSAYLLSEALGWELVPPTVFRRKLPLGPGSLQVYVEHNADYHYFNFEESDRLRLHPVVVFDLLINNADRKGSHIIKDEDGHLWLIDHGVCFHDEDKLRTVIWDFAGERVPEALMEDVRALTERIEARDELYEQLLDWLAPREVNAISARGRRLLATCRFPHPGGAHRPYPWPPV